ncbi:hypothetical protein GAYE_SCF09G3191 [Galdieria yellowstonensis]|uniref:Thioredoxin domain-containing protein n=1 Tax=Galdieria yellowstonensis TaxID=3028027 RepID=A0AAV9IDF0_9RHOD|nr:hypothetical protein GAYE_SCF09G3191 [Galdieria yellowstonensis]
MKESGTRIVVCLSLILLSLPLSYAKRKSSTHTLSTGLLSYKDAKQFLQFLHESPRDHAAVTLFIVDQGCEVCPIFQAEWERVARASKKAMQSHPVHFYLVYLSNDEHSRKLIESLQVRFVPLLFVFQPEKISSWPRALPEDSRDLYVLTRDTLSAEAIALFVKERTGLNVPVPRSFLQRWSTRHILMTFGALVFGVTMVLWMLGIVFRASFWSVVSVLVYCASVSGIHYSIQHHRPWIRKSAFGIDKYLLRGSWREQLAAEGAIFSSLCFFLSLSVVFLGYLFQRYPNVSKSRQKWVLLFSYLTFGVLVFLCFLMRTLWNLKFPGYLVFSQE